MNRVTLHELRTQSDAVVNRVAAGERLIITRRGTPVAELRPLTSKRFPSSTLLDRWRRLPELDYRKLRDDLELMNVPHPDAARQTT